MFAGADPDCSGCIYEQCQAWVPDDSNCHMYYVCDKTRGESDYQIHHLSCGLLYWDQARLTCVREAPEGCIIGEVFPYVPPTTTYGKKIRYYAAPDGLKVQIFVSGFMGKHFDIKQIHLLPHAFQLM